MSSNMNRVRRIMFLMLLAVMMMMTGCENKGETDRIDSHCSPLQTLRL